MWYGAKDLHNLFAQVTPADVTVGAIWLVWALLSMMIALPEHLTLPRQHLCWQSFEPTLSLFLPEKLGFIGKGCWPCRPGCARKTDVTITQAGAHIPYVVEAWASCVRSLTWARHG